MTITMVRRPMNDDQLEGRQRMGAHYSSTSTKGAIYRAEKHDILNRIVARDASFD